MGAFSASTSNYTEPLLEGAPRGGVISMVYKPDERTVTKSNMFGDDAPTEEFLQTVRDRLVHALVESPPNPHRDDVGHCSVQCCITEMCNADVPEIIASVADALHVILSGRQIVHLDPAHGRFEIHATAHTKPRPS